MPSPYHRPEGVVYLDGNSLGPLPLATRERLHAAVEEWADELVGGWQHWVDLPVSVGDRLGAALLGAGPGQVVVCDTVTAHLHRLAWAVLDAAPPGRRVVVAADREFPTDRFVLAAAAEQQGGTVRWVAADPVDGVRPDALAEALAPGDVALVSLSLVDYRSAALLDAAAVTAAVHDAGALMLWDLAHAAGAVPVALDAWGADLAVGCTYKYLNAGPGAPAFAYVRAVLAPRLRSPVPGWWSAARMFAMDDPYAPAAGAARFLSGSPNVLGLVAVDSGVRVLADAGGPAALRERSVALTSLLVELADARLGGLGFSVASPRDPARRGGHVVLRHADAYRLGPALADRGVVGDVRPPDLLRLAPVPGVVDADGVRRAVDVIAGVVTSGAHLSYPAVQGRVT